MTGANGIDVSNNNGTLSLSRGFTGLDFVIAKRSEGTTFLDSTYSHYQAEAKSLGVLFGAYHFLHSEDLDGQSEAEFFLAHYAPVSGQSIWVDYETYGLSPAADVEVIKLFAMTIKARVPHQKVGLYANLTGMERAIPHGVGSAVDAYWLAYPNQQIETPDGPMPSGSTWNVHQYETFNGIDRDYSRWTRAQFESYFTWA